jgi:DNA replication protein DnaC
MKAEGIGLYLFSETKGSGKTRMATSLANELMQEHDMTVRFTTSLDILSEIKATWNNDAEFKSGSQLLHYLNTAEVLVIDDFGTEATKDWIDERFYQIINTRYVNKLITIYTSNYSLDDLQYNDRITNRIKERVYQVRFPEESIRDGIAAARERRMFREMEG